MEPVNTATQTILQSQEQGQAQNPAQAHKRTPNPMFVFMGAGSLIYAFFYTLLLYRNHSGITFPFSSAGPASFSSAI